MGKTTRVNVFDEHDVYCGRPSRWGNPFVIGKDGSRSECIEKYREWVKTQKDLLDELAELKGLRLACYCGNESCHVDVLIELIEGMENRKKVNNFFDDETDDCTSS
jgi:hypothetical protein